LPNAPLPDEPLFNRPVPEGPFFNGPLFEGPLSNGIGPLPNGPLPDVAPSTNPATEDHTTPQSSASVVTNLMFHNKNTQRTLLLHNGGYFPFHKPLHSFSPRYQFPFGRPFPFVPYRYIHRQPHFSTNQDPFPYVSNSFCNCDSGSSCMISCHYSPHYKFGYRQY
ncbi:hypothetical protein GBAR_LOCUS19014, partial [Geodia barretti]